MKPFPARQKFYDTLLAPANFPSHFTPYTITVHRHYNISILGDKSKKKENSAIAQFSRGNYLLVTTFVYVKVVTAYCSSNCRGTLSTISKISKKIPTNQFMQIYQSLLKKTKWNSNTEFVRKTVIKTSPLPVAVSVLLIHNKLRKLPLLSHF